MYSTAKRQQKLEFLWFLSVGVSSMRLPDISHDLSKDKNNKWVGKGQHCSVHTCKQFTHSWKSSAGNQYFICSFICSKKVAICNNVSNWQLGFSGSWCESLPNNQFSLCKSEWPLQCCVPQEKRGVGLCWDNFGQGVGRGFRWLFLGCSSCHLQTLHITST